MKQKLSPYGVYLLARLCRLTNKSLPLARIGNTTEHMFAAVIGTEDGAQASLDTNALIPTEPAFLNAIRTALGLFMPITAREAARQATRKPAEPKSIVDEILEESEGRRV